MESSVETAGLRVRWWRVFVAGSTPPMLVQAAILLAPGIFSGVLGWVAMSGVLVWITALCGAWAAGGVRAESATLHGLLVGFVVAALGPAFGVIGPASLPLAALVILAGWTGGILGKEVG